MKFKKSPDIKLDELFSNNFKIELQKSGQLKATPSTIKGQEAYEFRGFAKDLYRTILSKYNSVVNIFSLNKNSLFEKQKLDQKIKFEGDNNFAGFKIKNISIESWIIMRDFLNSNEFNEYERLYNEKNKYKDILEWINDVYGKLPNRDKSIHSDKVLIIFYKAKGAVLKIIENT